jgi:hypothetical protein
MAQEQLRGLGLIDIAGVNALYAEHCANRDRTFLLWTFFVFASWVKRNRRHIA